MKKLLLDTGVLLAANQKEPAAFDLIQEGKNNPDVQLWVLAHATEKLVSAGLSPEQVQQLLKDIAQIPVNAYLIGQALQKNYPFEAAIYQKAAEVFKIDGIVSNTLRSPEDRPLMFTPLQALAAIRNEGGRQRVDFMNLNLGLHPIFNQVDGWFTEVIQNTAFAGGAHVDQFEKEFGEFCQAKHVVGVNSGTDALRFALQAMGVGSGDEVITVPNTFMATTEVISQLGARPVFVDVTPDTYTMDPEWLPGKITQKTKAIVPVHLYGQVANMDRILEIADTHGIPVLEDACQAHGAIYQGKRAGTLGRAAAFSMYPGKNLGAFGEAGCIVTNDAEIDEMARCLREHGQSQKYHHRMEGYNSRMDNLQAAALRGKLPYLDEWNQKRRQCARLYIEHLQKIEPVIVPVIPDFNAHVFHLFVILVPDPQALHETLKSKNIFTAFHYPLPLHLQEAYRDRNEKRGSYPVTENCADQLISLPMFPELTEEQVRYVCSEIDRFFSC